jgi:hypothetical protein
MRGEDRSGSCSRALRVALMVSLVGCGDPTPASPDGGPRRDGSPGPDGGPGLDDGGRLPDSGRPPIDAGPRPEDGGTFAGLGLELEHATPEQIGLHLIVERALDDDARIDVRYKELVESEWRTAHPLFRIHPDWIADGAPVAPVDSFAGTIFDLSPGTSYDVELTLEEPGSAAQTISLVATTRALPPPAPAATSTATPADDLQARIDALGPGDVLELAAGTYEVDGLQITGSGSEAEPIYVRGASRADVILHDASGAIIQVLDVSHVVIENLTLEGSGTDSGTDASSVAVSLWSGGDPQANITVRGVDVRGTDVGIAAAGATSGLLVYDNDLRGNNVWTDPFLHTNLTWNDDAIRIPGEGNVAFENTLHGYGDVFSFANGVFTAANYVYRNRITMSGDDAFESDYATRNLGFYDNHITNVATFLSCDPVWGGPLYAFRNVVINTFRGPLKLNNTNTGFLVYSNTIIRTEGRTGWGWVQFNNGDLRGWAYRNNLLVYRGSSGSLMAIESGANDPIDFTNNAWFPDGSVWWSSSGGSYGSIDAARSGLPATSPLFGTSTARHDGDVVLASDPFAATIVLGSDHLTEHTSSEVPELPTGSAAQGAGTAIPNVTDGHSGAAPDIGAIIAGRALPHWGAHR